MADGRADPVGGHGNVGVNPAAVRELQCHRRVGLRDGLDRDAQRHRPRRQRVEQDATQVWTIEVELGSAEVVLHRGSQRRVQDQRAVAPEDEVDGVGARAPISRSAGSSPMSPIRRRALGPSCSDAPVAATAGACSYTTHSIPSRDSVAAAVRPPTPPPTIATLMGSI